MDKSIHTYITKYIGLSPGYIYTYTLYTSTKNLSDFIGGCNQIHPASKVYLLVPNR